MHLYRTQGKLHISIWQRKERNHTQKLMTVVRSGGKCRRLRNYINVSGAKTTQVENQTSNQTRSTTRWKINNTQTRMRLRKPIPGTTPTTRHLLRANKHVTGKSVRAFRVLSLTTPSCRVELSVNESGMWVVMLVGPGSEEGGRGLFEGTTSAFALGYCTYH